MREKKDDYINELHWEITVLCERLIFLQGEQEHFRWYEKNIIEPISTGAYKKR